MNRHFYFLTGVLTIAVILLSGAIPTGSEMSEVMKTAFANPGSTASTAGAGAREEAKPSSANPLAGTRWQLLEIQSMDDTIGTVRPKDPSLFTMHLNIDGTVTMRLDCNRASGTWTAEPSGDGLSGRFEFGPLAGTSAVCLSPNLDERILAQAKFFRGYLLREGRLYLSLMADGGIYAWVPDTDKSIAASVPAAPEDGGPRNWKVSGVARSGGGYATVVLKKPDGYKRAIFFRMGRPIGADTSEADGYSEFRTTKENDLHLIRLGNERYEIPEAAVMCG